jgi:hypothetical protein
MTELACRISPEMGQQLQTLFKDRPDILKQWEDIVLRFKEVLPASI